MCIAENNIQQQLRKHFNGYQGANPNTAKYIFIGNNANWQNKYNNQDLENIKNYLDDGPKYWKDHGVHHPLLNIPNSPGHEYHQVFKRIGFTDKNANEICFFELLKIPTCNQYTTNIDDIINPKNTDHLNLLVDLLINTKSKFFFIPIGTCNLLNKARMKFNKIPSLLKEPLTLFTCGDNTVVQIYHFSSRKASLIFDTIMKIRKTCELVPEWTLISIFAYLNELTR